MRDLICRRLRALSKLETSLSGKPFMLGIEAAQRIEELAAMLDERRIECDALARKLAALWNVVAKSDKLFLEGCEAVKATENKS